MHLIYSLMHLGKLHMDTQRNWSAKGHTVHYVVCGSGIRPHRIKIDEEEGIAIVTHELDMLLVSCTTLHANTTLYRLFHTSPDFQLARNSPLDLRELHFPTLLFPRLKIKLFFSERPHTLIANMIVDSLS
jgi:hypothetical protein